MNVNEYIKKLKEFCKRDFIWHDETKGIRVRINNEIEYLYEYNIGRIILFERGEQSEVGSWNDNKTCDMQFAFLINAAIEDKEIYDSSIDFEKINNFQELDEIVAKRFDNKLFSVGKNTSDRLCITQMNGKFSIDYIHDNLKKNIETEENQEVAFARFYNELTYFAKFMKDISRYEAIFDQSFSENEKIDLIGY